MYSQLIYDDAEEWKNTIESMLGPKTSILFCDLRTFLFFFLVIIYEATLLDVKISASRETIGVFVQVEGEAPRETAIQVIRAATLSHLRTLITAQLDDFEFEYKFLNPSGYKICFVLSYINLRYLLFRF